MSKEQAKIAFDEAQTNEFSDGEISRIIAKRQIESGALRGYLAFVDDLAVGWCNANDKANYPIEPYTDECFYAPAEKLEKAVICFEIAPEFRGKGIATALLQRVVDDAAAEGYIAVEGFPVKRENRYEWDYTGPVRLYEKAGFNKTSENDKSITMRKELRN
jgi:GNAT superfamily N-acetyltransferase